MSPTKPKATLKPRSSPKAKPKPIRPLAPTTVVFAVEWIEVEFGQRAEGYRVFKDLELCKRSTLASSDKGAYEGGYCGPRRPLHYFEVPASALDAVDLDMLSKPGTTFVCTHERWEPKYKSHAHAIG